LIPVEVEIWDLRFRWDLDVGPFDSSLRASLRANPEQAREPSESKGWDFIGIWDLAIGIFLPTCLRTLAL